MKIKYKVLWFDDSSDLLDSLDLEYLQENISTWGLVPEVELVKTPEEFSGKAPYNEYDLLVVDYNLEGYGHGQDFIAQVREQEVFTEIIFYSSGATSLLWDAVHARQLEGVYIASKNTILERILKVGQQSLRKILDLENMRGIVMAEVGDLDLLLDDILRASIAVLDEDAQKDIFVRFYTAANEHHEKQRTALNSFNEAPTIDVLLSLCDSDKRWQNYGRTKRHHEVLKKKVLGDYVMDVLRPRNFLAHGVPTRNPDGSFTFRYQGKEYMFDEAVSTGLRTTIIQYKNLFSEISVELRTSDFRQTAA